MRISRTVDVHQDQAFGRWLDTVTNTTPEPLTAEVAFGGQTGYGATGTNASMVVTTASGDAEVTPSDSWTVQPEPDRA